MVGGEPTSYSTGKYYYEWVYGISFPTYRPMNLAMPSFNYGFNTTSTPQYLNIAWPVNNWNIPALDYNAKNRVRYIFPSGEKYIGWVYDAIAIGI